MANPARPFQSQVMTHVVKLYHRLTAKGTRWARHCRSTTRWWTQIALHPARVASDATRTAFQKVHVLTAQWRDRLGLNSHRSEPLEALSPLPTDWSIQQVSAAVLPSTAPNFRPLDTPVHNQPALSQPNDEALQVEPHQLPAGKQIQGLASSLENHALVLVSADNQIVACLSAAQQTAIAALMTQLMIAYDRWQQHRLESEHPGAVVRARTWWPVHLVAGLLAWMQARKVRSSVHEVSASKLGDQPLPHASLSGQSLEHSLPSRSWPQPLTLLQAKLGDRRWVQQGLQVVQGIQSRLKSVGESLASPFQLPPVQPNSELMTSPGRRTWQGPNQSLPQSLMPWSTSPTGQLTPVGSGERSDALMTAAMTVAGEVIATPKGEDRAADWINAEVLTTEYLERPLRRVWRWLDQLLLWLEKGLLRCWQWLRSHL